MFMFSLCIVYNRQRFINIVICSQFPFHFRLCHVPFPCFHLFHIYNIVVSCFVLYLDDFNCLHFICLLLFSTCSLYLLFDFFIPPLC